jgi:hypothetical protein
MVLVTDRDIWETLSMNSSWNDISPLDGAHYREIADQLRKLAHQCRFAGARRELLQLAASYTRRADLYDARAR